MDTRKARAVGAIVASEIDANAPTLAKRFWNLLTLHPGTPWLFIGIGIEAATITIMFAFVGVSYPVVDAITGLVAGGIILWYQRSKNVQ